MVQIKLNSGDCREWHLIKFYYVANGSRLVSCLELELIFMMVIQQYVRSRGRN